MNIEIPSGKYVVAVSGGVDSVVLLELVSKLQIPNSKFHFVVAHFDHGIRADSGKDRIFVAELANYYELPFYFEEGNLGPAASEATAREARYKFLSTVKRQTNSGAIMTAHNQDDVIETALINLLRGTKAKGLSSLRSTTDITRPLLDVPKSKIINYARANKLSWREDPTNQDAKYLRNYVRKNIVSKMTPQQRQNLLTIINNSAKTTAQISDIINNLMPDNQLINRGDFANLPHAAACELLADWLQRRGLGIDQKTVQRLVVGLKTAKNGAKLDINKNQQFLLRNGVIKFIEKEKFSK